MRKLALILPTVVVANSHSTLSTLHLPKKRRTAVVYSGISLPPAPAERHWGSPVRIGLVGRIARWKGQHVFLQAAAETHSKFPDTRFIIIGAPLFGEEEYAEELKEQAKRAGIEEYVEWQGFRDDVLDAVSDLDIMVHASITAEPFGQVIVEGMAMEKPVIATAGGGVLEIVEDGVTGLLVPMGDSEKMSAALCQLLHDEDRAREMGRKGRERVIEKFTSKQTSEVIQKLYADMVS